MNTLFLIENLRKMSGDSIAAIDVENSPVHELERKAWVSVKTMIDDYFKHQKEG